MIINDFYTNLKYFGIFRLISVFETTAMLNFSKNAVFSSGSFCQIYRVTDEALIAKTAVRPNFVSMNVFFALKGFKPVIIIYSIMKGAETKPETEYL